MRYCCDCVVELSADNNTGICDDCKRVETFMNATYDGETRVLRVWGNGIAPTHANNSPTSSTANWFGFYSS